MIWECKREHSNYFGRSFYHAIAKLGGSHARRSDGQPGWLTMWRAWKTLMILVRGYELATKA